MTLPHMASLNEQQLKQWMFHEVPKKWTENSQ
jgi:hypothetical protein